MARKAPSPLGLVEGVAGIAVAAETANHLGSAPTGRCLGLDDQIGGSLTEVQSGTGSIEGTALLVVEDHERVEAVKMEFRDALRTAYDGYLRLAAANKVGAKDDGVGCR